MKTLLIVLLSVALSVTAMMAMQNKSGAGAESVYDRVMRTGVLRCGYATWPPLVGKNPQTGQVEGPFAQITEKMAENLGLKVEWAEETGWGNFIEGLESRRFDLFCAPTYLNSQRGRHVYFSTPLAYSALHLYTRADDDRFDTDLSRLNATDVRIATQDGEGTQVYVTERFPLAKQVAIPQISDSSQLPLNVATGKADGAFLETSLAVDFMKNNPGKIKQATKNPVRIYADTFPSALGEEKFSRMIDSALVEMRDSGETDAIIEKYDPERTMFLPVAKPYEIAP